MKRALLTLSFALIVAFGFSQPSGNAPAPSQSVTPAPAPAALDAPVMAIPGSVQVPAPTSSTDTPAPQPAAQTGPVHPGSAALRHQPDTAAVSTGTAAEPQTMPVLVLPAAPQGPQAPAPQVAPQKPLSQPAGPVPQE